MKYIVNSFYVKTGIKKGVFGLASPAPFAPDLEAMNNELAKVCNDMDAAGYDPVHVIPLQIGTDGGSGKNTGWAITRGATVVGRRRDG